MLRIIVGVLAAFVGFSFGHSIPKWMECKGKASTGVVQSPPSSTGDEPAQRLRKHYFRRKSLRKFKFGFHRTGKDGAETHDSMEKLCKEENDGDGDAARAMDASLHAALKCVKNAPLFMPGRLLKDQKKLEFGSQKSIKDESRSDSSFNQQVDSAMNKKLVPAEKLQRDSSASTALSALEANKCRTCEQVEIRAREETSRHNSALSVPAISNGVSESRACVSQKEEQSQVRQWKMKLRSLRSKAMASEKLWYEKFENAEKDCGGGKLLVSSPMVATTKKLAAKGKENESSNVVMSSSSKKKDFFWRRSSSRVGLLVEGPKSPFER